MIVGRMVLISICLLATIEVVMDEILGGKHKLSNQVIVAALGSSDDVFDLEARVRLEAFRAIVARSDLEVHVVLNSNPQIARVIQILSYEGYPLIVHGNDCARERQPAENCR